MLHYSAAKKNKHQHDLETPHEMYLYKEHRIPKNLSSRLSEETRAELDDDIFYMRRHFKRTVNRLKGSMYYSNWLKSMPEKDALNWRMKLRSRQA